MITRMILVKVPPDKSAEAERLWREDCGALLIEQPGCKSEQFLRSREHPGEFISLSIWIVRRRLIATAAVMPIARSNNMRAR